MSQPSPRGLLGRLFLTGEDERVYATVRIGFALVSLLNLILLWPLRHILLADGGSTHTAAVAEHSDLGSLLLFEFFHTPAQVDALLACTALAILALATGVLPRLAAAWVMLWHLSLLERLSQAGTGWDLTLRAFGFLVLISPPGRCWSLPALLSRSPRPSTLVPRYGLVLMQLQVAVIYWQTVVLKLTNPNPYWWNGEFLAYFFLSHYSRWPGAWPAHHPGLMAAGTWLTLLVELAIPILLLMPGTRLWGALLGLLLHGLITLAAPEITPFMLVLLMTYAAFLTGQDINAIDAWLRRHWPGTRGSGRRPDDPSTLP